MTKWLGSIVVCLGLTILIPGLRAQAVYTADKTPAFQAGAGFLYVSPDYGQKADQGASAWIDANLFPGLGLEAQANIGFLLSPSDYGENSYFIGPRLTHRSGKGQVYLKGMVGLGTLVYDRFKPMTQKSYAAYAVGGGLDYRVSRSFNYRVFDAEYQTWPGFKPNGLTPFTVSTGLMYIIH